MWATILQDSMIIYIYTLFNFNNMKYEIDLLKEGGPPLWSNAH